MKFLQLNIEGGRCLPEVLSFIEREKIDIVCLQEVSGGAFSKSGDDCFTRLIGLGGYRGELAPAMCVAGAPWSYRGNAVLWRTAFVMRNREVLWLKPYKEYPDTTFDPRDTPRCALAVTLEQGGTQMVVVSTHLAWGPTPKDEEYKLSQGRLLYDWARRACVGPFILSGDFNVDASSQIVTWLNTIGRNLTVQYGVTNTLNPRLHAKTALFPSGLAVDYIYVNNDMHVETFSTIEEDLSDHFGLLLTADI